MSKEGRIEKVLWSIALPGFGQLLNGKFLKGLLLILLEFLINVQSNFNQAIIYVKAENTRDFSRGMNRLIFLKNDTKFIENIRSIC